MNERLKQLAEQAEMFAIEDQFNYHERLKEKFAELIIRECAGIAHGSDRPSKDIKDHFGFEE